MTASPLRVLGIDPGTITTGYGVVERHGSRLIHIDNGLICGRKGDELSTRLMSIYEGLTKVLREFRPDMVAVESVFSHKNTRSALSLGHARGVILLAVEQTGVSVTSYAPALIKKTVAGRGRADKFQMQMMVKTLLGLPEIPAEDAADALAMSICHHHHHRGRETLDRTTQRTRR